MKPFYSLMFGASLAVVAACAPMIDTHGDVLNARDLASLRVGESTRGDVQRLFGSPSSRALFDSEDWIYIHSKQERRAFFKPRETERDVTVFKFDRAGVLQSVETKTLADGRNFAPAPQAGENGQTLTVLDQMMSNVGRMSTDAPVR